MPGFVLDMPPDEGKLFQSEAKPLFQQLHNVIENNTDESFILCQCVARNMSPAEGFRGQA